MRTRPHPIRQGRGRGRFLYPWPVASQNDQCGASHRLVAQATPAIDAAPHSHIELKQGLIAVKAPLERGFLFLSRIILLKNDHAVY